MGSLYSKLVLFASLFAVGACEPGTVHRLNSRPVAVDARSVAIDLSPPVTQKNYYGICLRLDTTAYAFHPQPAAFTSMPLTDTTIVPRLPGGGEGAPIALRAYLLSNNGSRLDFPVAYADSSPVRLQGTLPSEPSYTRYALTNEMAPSRADVEVCFAKPPLTAGAVYNRLVLRSSTPLTIKRVEQGVWSGP